MKKTKLLSAVALSVALLTATSGAVSAAVVDATGKAKESTANSAGFVTDNTTVVDPQLPGGGGVDTFCHRFKYGASWNESECTCFTKCGI